MASNIVKGVDHPHDAPSESIGKYIFKCLKSRHPDETIIVDPVRNDVLTVRQLLEDSIKMTEVYKKLSVNKGDTISIISENTLTYCVPVLAAFYMGIAVSPINPAYLKAELIHTLDLSKPKIVISSPTCLNKVQEAREEIDCVANVLLIGSEESAEDIGNLIKTVSVDLDGFLPYDLDYSVTTALLMLSSGTTGLPKTVMLSHQNLCAPFVYLKAEELINLTKRDVSIAALPFFHIYGTLIQLGAITLGMKLILLSKFKPETFLQTIQDYGVTKLFIVPSLLLFMAKSPIVDNYDLSSLKTMYVGGAAIGSELHKEASERFKNIPVRIIYGLTEASGMCTLSTGFENKPGCVGTLIPGIYGKVCDMVTGETLRPKQIGELCFKGSIVMKGYLNNEKATEECIDKDGFLHTGDVGYFHEERCFVVDRIKELIKCKGFQVSPVEVETVLLSNAGVSDCGVIGIPDERCGEVPFAFVVKQKDQNLTEEDVKNYVAERISAEKQLNGGVRFVDGIPRTSTGKIMRREMMDNWKSLHGR